MSNSIHVPIYVQCTSFLYVQSSLCEESHAQVHKRIHVLVAMLEKEMVGWGGLHMLHYFNLSLVFGF